MATIQTVVDRQQLAADHTNKELLRFITCGSVDDGKSTLIGRLLLESGNVYQDQLAALRQDSAKHGTTGGEIDTALLLDGLEDERQQGITIDVAYRYFTTAKRKFIIADTPGHEQFTRNMATGASTVDLALILVDASKGILTQTKRHAFIVSLLGIKHMILAVNKMDLVDYQASVFEQIRLDFSQFAEKLDIPEVRFVPLSALNGDNVAEPSARMPWSDGGSLLHQLDNIYVGSDRNLRDLRFPVQWVNRPDSGFRGFSGTLASGTLRVGDPVVVLPSKKVTCVDRIVTRDGDLPEATASRSVTVKLADEIDITRGDMLVHPDNRPHVSRQLEAMIVWMSEQPLVPGKPYAMKHTTRRTSAEVQTVRHAIDVNTLHRTITASLKLNEIGRCQLMTHDPIVFDAYRRNRETGSFILVDRITHETVAAGMLLDPHSDDRTAHWDVGPAGTHLQRAISRVPEVSRQQRYGQRPLTILITGLSGVGKSSLALGLEERLFQAGKVCVVLDGQNMRSGISRELGFTSEDRSENLRRAAEIAATLNDAGLICLAAFVAPQAEVRERVRTLIGPDRFLQVHLDAPLEVCRQRDCTGRYQAADRGQITSFPGVTADYERPRDADLYLETAQLSAEDCVQRVFDRLTRSGVIAPAKC